MTDKFDYEEAHADALELITIFGGDGQVIKEGNDSGWDDSQNPIPIQSDTIINGTVSPKVDCKTAEIDGKNVLRGDAYVFFDSATSPEIGMMITLNNDKYRIVNLKVLDSLDGINVFRRLQLRR